MKWLKHLKSRLFLKYFLSFMTLFLFLFSLFGIYLFVGPLKDVSEEIEVLNQTNLSQIEIFMSEKFRSIHEIGNRIGVDPIFSPLIVERNKLNNSTTNELKKYKANNNGIDDIYLNYGGTEVYSSRGFGSITAVSDNNLYFHEYTHESLQDEFNKPGISYQLIHFPTGMFNKVGTKLAYSMPLNTGRGGDFGRILFILNTDDLIKQLETIKNQSMVFILDENENLIFYDSDLKNEELIVKEIKDLNNLVDNIDISGVNYVINTEFSPYLRWTYGLVMIENQLLEPVIQTYRRIISWLIILLLVGIIISLGLAMYHYKPLDLLFKDISNSDGNIDDESIRLNRIDSINDAVYRIINENKYLQSEIEAIQPLIRNQLITRLLEGTITKTQAEELINSNQLNFDSLNYVIASSKIVNSTETTLDTKLINQAIETYSDFVYHNLTINALFLDYKQEIVFIIGFDNIDNIKSSEMISQFLQSVVKEMNSLFDKNIVFGVGMAFTDISKIKPSYIESLAALDFSNNENQNPILFYDNYEPQTSVFTFLPKQLLNKLKQSLVEAESEIALESLAEIFSYINNSKLNSSEFKYAIFEIIQLLINSIQDESFILNRNEVDIVMENDDLSLLYSSFKKYSIEICKINLVYEEESKSNIASEIITYINNHYLSHSISLEEISTEFNLSLSYVSRIIKDHQKVSFNTYLQDLRMEEFKRRLVHTDNPIKSIVQSIGYVDASNFTRKFKKIYGQTPSEYRKNNR